MNVLIYSGPGSTVESVKACNDTLRQVLSPYYAVSNVNAETLIGEPWAPSTSLLVFPGGADLPYCRELDGKGNDSIKKFVRSGGRYLGFCAGGYYGSSRIEFEAGDPQMEVSGPRQLAFFPGLCKGSAFKGFQYNSHVGARLTKLDLEGMRRISGTNGDNKLNDFECYFNGGGCFFYESKFSGTVDVVAEYTEPLDIPVPEDVRPAAIVRCKFGQGWAVLTGAHPEFGAELFNRETDLPQSMVTGLNEETSHRLEFMRSLLASIGLRVNNDTDVIVPRLSRLCLSSKSKNEVTTVVNNLLQGVTMQGNILVGQNDTFQLHDRTGQIAALNEGDSTVDQGELDEIKHIDIYNEWPAYRQTPHFNHELYYSALDTRILGRTVLYGEVVTSTSTMLEKNYEMLKSLPTGFIAVGTIQVSGRGRGNNVWVSPEGVLAHSGVLRIPVEQAQNMVFVQYVVSLAIVESIRSYGPGYEQLPVRLKWPNDIYALPSMDTLDSERLATPGQYVKLGGILVNSNVFDSDYVLVFGAGINVDNAAPTTSVNKLVENLNECRRKEHKQPLPLIKKEVLLAKIQAQLETMVSKLIDRGFSSFEDQYYYRWLHSNQQVTLEEYGNIKAVIKGISSDYGMLVVRDASGSQFELQPNGNSFDMFKSLLKRKT